MQFEDPHPTHRVEAIGPADGAAPLRSYPRNTPEAAARIVALALIANGRIQAVEVAALDALHAHERLGLTPQRWHAVIHDLCTDLLGPARCGDDACVSSELLGHLLDEVDDDRLRHVVLHLCSAVVQADRQIDDAESFVLLGAIERWGLPPDDHALLEPMLYGADFQVRPRGLARGTSRKLGLR
ncbi:MAG TPA: TerB family tellurite resistance protein [Rhizobacter sp.]|nr:TerB family tellurite resistance protein [Rhizobacter sp.]